MITVAQALNIIANNTMDFGTELVPLSNSTNRILKEDWTTDRDLPPYHRITMDGIAIAYAAFEQGQRAFPIQGIAAAGMPQQTLAQNTDCLEVMTGAILPSMCDTIIRYEDLDIQNNVATVQVDNVRLSQNVHFKGEDKKANELVVRQGIRISPAEIGVGASVGKSQVRVAKLPKVMVISTGDELVNIDQQPLAHQIRRSNVYRLLTSLQNDKILADSDHLNDAVREIEEKIAIYLQQYDVLILSGGVSKGKFDYIPQVLEKLGVQKLFHRVQQRPGKPFWFGKYGDKCTIFALPGNPVSSFMCMQRYFKTWLSLCQTGQTPTRPYAVLAQAVDFKPDLVYYLEVKISYSPQGQIVATPKKGNGSGDLANIVEGDAFIELPQGRNRFEAGEVFPIYFYRG